MTEATKEKALTVPELREKLRQAEVEAAYYRGRTELAESLLTQRAQPAGAAGLPPELITALIAAKMKDQKDAQEGV